LVDFTSANYLGLSHPSSALREWERISLGVPAVLADPPGALDAARELAALQDCGRATLATSTLHLFWDLFGQFDPEKTSIFVDRRIYPIGMWGVERAAARGVPLHFFAHFDPASLRATLGAHGAARRPIVVADGYCPDCGHAAPIPAYLNSIRRTNGLLVDDTQAIGILGTRSAGGSPIGAGGGGSLRWHGVTAPDSHRVLIVTSLAKAFGAPVAALSGSTPLIATFENGSRTRVHCSPPSVPNIRALSHALALNREYGDSLRSRLLSLVTRFRKGLRSQGIRTESGLFPVQSIAVPVDHDPHDFAEMLRRRGVAAVVTRNRETAEARLTFIITARHTFADIDCAMDAILQLYVTPMRGREAV